MMMAVMMCSCSQDGASDKKVPSRFAIGFDNGSVDNSVAVRGITPLEDHHSTMGVWGWETDESGEDNPIFVNQLVEYDAKKADWFYTPLKYWINENNYHFYGYAPQTTAATIKKDGGLISIPDVVLTGVNLQSVPSDTIKDSFMGSADTDWMVAREGIVVPGTYRYKVKFMMQHILSKFIVTMELGDVLAADSDLVKVELNEMTLGEWPSKGSFTQVLHYTPNPEVTEDAETVEWTLDETATPYTLATQPASAVSGKRSYVIETLVFPQYIKERVVTIRYSMTFSDGRVEKYRYTMRLDEVFKQFCSGNCYLLHFIINPECITFDSGVSDWAEEVKGVGY